MPLTGKYIKYTPEINLEIFTLIYDKLGSIGVKPISRCEPMYSEFKKERPYLTYHHGNDFGAYSVKGSLDVELSVKDLLGYDPFVKNYKIGDRVRLPLTRPKGWESAGEMDKYLGKDVVITDIVRKRFDFKDSSGWTFLLSEIAGYTSDFNATIPDVKVAEGLPDKWVVKNNSTVGAFYDKKCGSDCYSRNYQNGYLYSHNCSHQSILSEGTLGASFATDTTYIPQGYVEITFDQFEKYVMKTSTIPKWSTGEYFVVTKANVGYNGKLNHCYKIQRVIQPHYLSFYGTAEENGHVDINRVDVRKATSLEADTYERIGKVYNVTIPSSTSLYQCIPFPKGAYVKLKVINDIANPYIPKGSITWRETDIDTLTEDIPFIINKKDVVLIEHNRHGTNFKGCDFEIIECVGFDLKDYDLKTRRKIVETKKELTMLPKEWHIKVTHENVSALQKWRTTKGAKDINLINHYLLSQGHSFGGGPDTIGYCVSSKPSCAEISFEDFKKYVLKTPVVDDRKAFKDNLLIEANRRFPKGTRFKSAYKGNPCTVNELSLSHDQEYGITVQNLGGGWVYCEKNGFAEFNHGEGFKPTTDQIFEKAKEMYPIGTKYKDQHGDVSTVLSKLCVYPLTDGEIIITDGNGGSVYKNGIWSQIIGEPEFGKIVQYSIGDIKYDASPTLGKYKDPDLEINFLPEPK